MTAPFSTPSGKFCPVSKAVTPPVPAPTKALLPTDPQKLPH
ncbi:hypothetical protein OWR28_20825 [Chryseobacterium sp. 1B4]